MKVPANPLKSALLATGLLVVAQAQSFAWVVDEATIRDKVTAHVQEQLKTVMPEKDDAKVNIEIIRVPAAPFDFPEAISADGVEISAESALAENYSERAVVRIKMSGPEGRSREIGVPVRLTIQKPVWVVKHHVDAKQPLKASDFSLELREVSRIYSHAVGQERPLNKYAARVNLRPGDILDARKIVIPPDIKRNTEIKIVLTNGKGMSVTLPGIAMADGRIGETIQVRQVLYQRKYYTAKIIDKNRVLIEI